MGRCKQLLTIILIVGAGPSTRAENSAPSPTTYKTTPSLKGAYNPEVPTYADLRPTLTRSCNPCHAGPYAPKELATDTYADLIKGSQSGPVVIAGKPEDSPLMHRVTGSIKPKMPMTGPPFLTDAEIANFNLWITAGMPEGSSTIQATRMVPRNDGITYADVAPIFAQRCVQCHSTNGTMGAPPEGYQLISLAHTLSAFDRARVVPGNALASELIRRIRGLALPRMPLKGPPLSAEEINLVTQWINEGARDSMGRSSPIPEGARVRLNGTLSGRWALDGLALQTTSKTKIDKEPRPGNPVEVRGTVLPKGTIQANRIRGR